jgi:hypothetical protein
MSNVYHVHHPVLYISTNRFELSKTEGQLLNREIIRWAISKSFRKDDLHGLPENFQKGNELWKIYPSKCEFVTQSTQLSGKLDYPLSHSMYKIWQVIESKYPFIENIY